MVFYDDLGFAANYQVEADIEYPGDGNWGDPIAGNGDSVLARITPVGGAPWLLAGGGGPFVAIYGTPNPNVFCHFVQFDDIDLVEARDRSIRRLKTPVSAVSIRAVPDHSLLLIVGSIEIIALGVDGVRWRSGRLFSDDLRVRRTDNDRIVCRGWNYWEISQTEVTLDAASGELISGEPYPLS